MPIRGALGDFGGSQEGHKKKEQSVSGHVQIKIHKAVHQKTATRHKSGEMQRGGKGFFGDQQLLQRTEEQSAQEPDAAESPAKAGVR